MGYQLGFLRLCGTVRKTLADWLETHRLRLVLSAIIMTAMPSGRSASEVAVLAVFCVLTIFLFPVVQGPYPAVHGPVTALQAARASARLRIAIALFASTFSRFFQLPLAAATIRIDVPMEFRPFALAECDGILRC